MADQQEFAKVDWRDGQVPVSTRFDDPYFSLRDGIGETGHVFLAGNDLPARFCPGFHIGELGFGTGLNMLCAWAAWEKSGQQTPLRFTSFEAFPLQRRDLEKAHAQWPDLLPWSKRFLANWDWQQPKLQTKTLCLEVIVGDARKELAGWNGSVDAWFLDGFSPTKNPELWQAGLLQDVGLRTKAGGSFATYTAAGHVRRALADAGFEVNKTKGFGHKRHMTRGRLKEA